MPVVNVWNRYCEPVEIQYDAAFNPESPYRWEPGEIKALPQDVALFCRRKSVIKEDPITGKQVRALVVQGVDQEFQDRTDMPAPALLEFRGAELLDRENMDARDRTVSLVSLVNPSVSQAERASVSPETHARRVPV